MSDQQFHDRIYDDIDNEVVVDMVDWLETRCDSNPRKAAAALVTGLSSILSQTSSGMDQAKAVGLVYARFMLRSVVEMKHIEEHHMPENDND